MTFHKFYLHTENIQLVDLVALWKLDIIQLNFWLELLEVLSML